MIIAHHEKNHLHMDDYIWSIIEILQLSHEAFRNLIRTANCKAAEVNSLNSDKLPGRFIL